MRIMMALALAGVASAAWTTEQRGIATIALSVSCADTQTCFIGGVQNGPGNVVFRTTNNGDSWEQQYLDPEGLQMMFLTTLAVDARRAVIAGFGFGTNAQFTTDGQNFRNTGPTGLPAVSYSSTYVVGSPDTIALPGYFTDGNHAAVAISRDAGATWTVHPTGRPALETTRFGSFPAPNTWFVAGGQQPRPDDHEGVYWVSERVKIEHKGNNSKAPIRMSYQMDENNQPVAWRPAAEYVAVVSRSRDGGRTFERVFYEEEAGYYLNYIDCPTVNLCFVVGEGPANARILRTRNGGDTWEVVWRAANSKYDLMGLEFINDQEGWACGMKHQPRLVSIFLHTTNGGQTWREVEGPDAMLCFSLTFPNARQGKATAIEVYAGISSVLRYTA